MGSSKKKRLPKLLAIYLSISFLLLIFRAGYVVNTGRNLLIYLISPIPEILTRLLSAPGSLGTKVSQLVLANEENKVLRQRLNSLLREREKFYEAIQENERLRRILQYKEETGCEFISARVVGWVPSTVPLALLIDKGKEQKISKDDPVVTVEPRDNPLNGRLRLVGRVVEVGAGSSKVMLITDPSCEVSAMVERSQEKGVVVGWERRSLLLKYLSPDADIEVGDIIVTSGMGRIFPAGLLVGRVEEVLYGVGKLEKQAVVAPFVNVNRLHDVQILKSEQTLLTNPQ